MPTDTELDNEATAPPQSHQDGPQSSGGADVANGTHGIVSVPETTTESKALVKAPDLYEQMAKTWALGPDDLMLLVNAPPKGTLTVGMALRVRAASIQYAIPIPGFNLIPTGGGGYTLYINAAGIQFRLATDPRGLDSIVSSIEHMVEPTKEKDYISVKATIKMKDGSMAEDYGISEWPVSGKDAQMRLGDLTMKLITKAIRRASTRLVGTTLPVYDEDYYSFISGAGKDVIDAEYTITKPKPKPEKPTVVGELCVMALDLNPELTGTKLMEIMGVNAITELDIEKTWERIQNEYGSTKAA